MIAILIPVKVTEPEECQCALCHARRLEDEQHIIEQMEARLRSLARR